MQLAAAGRRYIIVHFHCLFEGKCQYCIRMGITLFRSEAHLLNFFSKFNTVKWLNLSERRDLHKLFLFFKMNHGLSPLYLSILLPSHVCDVSSYRLCNAENYVGIHANTRAYAESFLSSNLQALNNLPEAVCSADTLASFKHHLTLDTPKVPKYHCGDRLEHILHTRPIT